MAARSTILWTGPALDDLREMRRYVAADDPAAARRLGDRIRRRVALLGRHPVSGRAVPELPGLGLREVIVAPYRIVYEVDAAGKRVIILRVWHGRRDLAAGITPA